MTMMKDKEREFLTKEFSQKLVDEVRLIVFTQDTPCVYCRETVDLANELADASPKLKVEVYDFIRDQMKAKELRIDKIPAMAVIGRKDYGIRFYGIPSGYEFNSLVGAIMDVSRGESGLSQKSKDSLKGLDQVISIQVFVTPTCPYCPSSVRLAHKMAIESDMVWADMIEANEFIPLAQKHAVSGVPKIIINEKFEIAGAVPEDILVAHVVHAATHREPLQPR
ncbi:MAG: thioredoxin family protein [Thermoplasmata archaeon]|nr:thioredoxin family protein [Thermoplasmata archaeon]MCJ7561773.1 thioredoxin family protein [Thermoplasmata archaeon]TFG68771.1 MAG: glutaredoxin [Methanomassiliicoccus sp.]